MPLTELSILVGMIVLAVAFLGGGPRVLLVAFGLVLVVLATGELALREHLAGYRSHSALLAGLAALVVAVPLAAFVAPAEGRRARRRGRRLPARAAGAARALPPPLGRRELARVTARRPIVLHSTL